MWLNTAFPQNTLLLLALLTLLAACGKEPVAPEPARPVLTRVLGESAGDEILSYSGEVRSRYEIPLAFRIPGKITARLVDTGAVVKAGEVLARLDPADTALAAAAASAQLDLAAADLGRFRNLHARNFVSQAALDAKETGFRTAQVQADLARNQTAYTVLKAEQAGVVGLVTAEVGQVVAAGQSVMRLARADTLEVAISIPEARMPELRALQSAEVSLWADNEASYPGTLREVSAVADPVTRSYAARVAIHHPDARVLLGMTARVHFHRPQGKARLTVPLTAIFQHAGHPALWVVSAEQTVTLRPVAIARYREDNAVLDSGVQAGERIVVAGVHKLSSGEHVQVIEQAPRVEPPAGKGSARHLQAMISPNLSEWALRHRSLVAYLIVVLMLGGVLAYIKLGRAEDPDFTFKAMVVRTLWPGATANEVQLQVTERIEKRLQEVPWVDVLRSQTRSGESLITVLLKDYTPKKEVPETWYQVRKKIGDMRHTLPQGVLGPFINDEFGDTFISIYALTGDGFDLAMLRREADRIARELRQVPDVKKIELIGVQEEKIYIEVSHVKLATLGLNPLAIFDALQKQNAMTPAGFYETPSDRVRIRVSGDFKSLESIREVGIQADGRLFRLGDIARVERGFADPPTPRMRVQGQDAIGIAIAMNKGGDVIRLGDRLRAETERLQKQLPLGIDMHVVADQPQIVRQSMNLFMSSLAEAVLIVLAVSFLSLGLRTGAVVALSIPLVLAVTFLLMAIFGIDLQRISLGALVISLGLLVDDAIIAVEMMVVKMEQGWDRFRAATFAYTSTAFPMLTGTLITAVGFMPVGLAKSGAGEYTFSIFAVVSIALLVSWVVAVLFTPYLGYLLLDADKLHHNAQQHGEDTYQTPFYRRVRATIEWSLRHRWLVIAATLTAFVAALAGLGLGVQKQFFPASSRPELLVDLWLPNGASLQATETASRKVEAILAEPEMKRSIKYFASYLGNGSPRFYLPLDQQLFNDNFAQLVITTHDLAAREDLKRSLEERFGDVGGEWSGLRTRVLRLENGPPVGFPVVFRVSGEDLEELQRLAAAVADVMRANPHLKEVNFDWNEMGKMIRIDIDQDRARALGVSSQELSAFLHSMLTGVAVTQMRAGDQLVDVIARAAGDERARISALADINIHTRSGLYVPLAQLAKISFALEDTVIARRNRLPTISVRADLRDGMQAPAVTAQIDPLLDALRARLPPGFRIEAGGASEESAKGENSIKAVMPLMLVGVITLLMIQLQNVGRMLLVLLTAPLGLIGVALALLIFQVPFGFVANLGVIALSGMIMRNSVILVDQIEQDEKAGKPAWEAIIGSTVRRFRPIMLTAAAAILAMIPLTRSVFWGPMAVAIMGGLIVATLLTLWFLPALYAACYRVRPVDPRTAGTAARV